MRVKYTVLFNKDMLGIYNSIFANKVESVIENVKQAKSIVKIKNLKKLKGYKNHFRIRIGDYRIGLFISK